MNLSNPVNGCEPPIGFPGLPSDWMTEWEEFDATGGDFKLFSLLHRPKNWDSQKALLILHGQGEHSGRYLHFSNYLQKDVGAIYAYDHRGHGRSGGVRGHVDDFDLYVDDARMALERLNARLVEKFGSSEIHLFAHSMGGLIALRLLMEHQDLPIVSASISAPLLELAIKVPAVKKFLGNALNQLWPSLTIPSGLDPKLVSRDPNVVSAYQKDNLNHGVVSTRFFSEMNRAMEDTRMRTQRLGKENAPYPLKFFVPLSDKIVNPNATIEFFNKLDQPGKEMKLFPEFFHESFNEIGKEKAFDSLRFWINRPR